MRRKPADSGIAYHGCNARLAHDPSGATMRSSRAALMGSSCFWLLIRPGKVRGQLVQSSPKEEGEGRRDCVAVRHPLGTPLLRRPQLSGHQEPQVTPHRPQDQAPGTHWVRTGRKPCTRPYTHTHTLADRQTDRHTDAWRERERERELRRHKTAGKHSYNRQGKPWPIF